MIISSVLITLLTTLIGAFQVYQMEYARLNKQMGDLLKVDAQALAESIWVLDQIKMQTIIDQIYAYKPVDFIELKFADKSPIKTLGFKPSKSIEFSFDLKHSDVELANLKIYTNFNYLVNKVKSSILNNIMNFFFLTFMTCLLLYMVIHFFLTRHLLNISGYLKNLDFKKPDKLKLNRSELNMFKGDELAGIVESINEMVQKSYLNNENLEKKVAERTQDLETAIKQVKKSSEIKSQFLANMSHEIRTPLNGIVGISDMLVSKIKDQSLQKYLHYLSESNTLLLKIVNDILDISKIEAGKITLEKTTINFYQLLNDIIDTLKIRANKKSIQLNCQISNSLPELICSDPVRLRQVLTNVLDNAIKFTNEGKINLECDSKKNQNEVEIFILVTDTGTGFDEERKKYLFDIFTQEDDSTTRRFGGSGLGLSICKGILNLMNGSIDLNNRPEGGTECKISFFASLHTIQKTEINKIDSIKVLNNKVQEHILVVEDNEINLELMRSFVEDLAISVTYANNGKEAIELCKENFFPLILMDCHMPVMDGYEASRYIRKFHQESTRPYIVAVTASAMEADIKKCKDAGMDYILTKPIKRHKLAELFKKLIARKIVSISQNVA